MTQRQRQSREISRRIYTCSVCGSVEHRRDRGCPGFQPDTAYTRDRIEWIAEQKATRGRISTFALHTEWCRENGYCVHCPKRTSRWYCEECSIKRALQPSRIERSA